MITSPQDYYKALQSIKNKNKPQYAILLPKDETIYNIDLNKREVEAPPFLGLINDNYAETIYFKVDRFFDNMDLADTTCSIQYTNSGIENDEGRSYLVPFFDIYTYKDQNKILLPWQISGEVARASGIVNFSFRFFKLNDRNQYVYNLNTKTATSKVLSTLDLELSQYDDEYKNSDIITNLQHSINVLSGQIGIYWTEA